MPYGPTRPRIVTGDSVVWIQTDHWGGYTARRVTVLDVRANQRVRIVTVDDQKQHTVKTHNLYTDNQYRASYRTTEVPN